jgi:hypothetical protein
VFDSNNWPAEGFGSTVRAKRHEVVTEAQSPHWECLTPSRAS